jgi:hypothetical protein
MARRQERRLRVRNNEVGVEIFALAVTCEEEACAALSGTDVTDARLNHARHTEGEVIMRDTWTR